MSCSREPVGHWEKQGGQQVSTRVQENKAKSPTSNTLVIWPQASSYSGPVPLLEAQWNHPLPRVFGRFKWETEIMAVVIIIDHCILRGAGCCAVLCLVAQSCPTLCDPMDCSPPGSSVRGILQARILEWVATPSSRGSSPPRDRTHVSGIAGGFSTVWVTRKVILSLKRLKPAHLCNFSETFTYCFSYW